MGKKSSVLTPESSCRSLMIKFYGEQLVYTYGSDEQKQILNGFSYRIKDISSDTNPALGDEQKKAMISQIRNEMYQTLILPNIKDLESHFCERLTSLDPTKYHAFYICHDSDFSYNPQCPSEPILDTIHYHVVIIKKTIPLHTVSPFKLKQFIGIPTKNNLCIINLRDEFDTNIWEKGVDTCKDVCASVAYLTHRTDDAIQQAKHLYNHDCVISNTHIVLNENSGNPDSVKELELNPETDGYTSYGAYIDGYKTNTRVSINKKIQRELDARAYQLGKDGLSLEPLISSLPYDARNMSSFMKTVNSSYQRGIGEYLESSPIINRLCVFISGGANLGKTTSSLLALKSLGCKSVHKVIEGTGKFDKLTIHNDAMLVDDTTATDLLRASDNRVACLYKRNSGDGLWAGKYLIVNSNASFRNWFRACCGIHGTAHGEKGVFMGDNYKSLSQYDAVKSRFFLCTVNSQTGHLELNCSSARGDMANQLLLYGMYRQFEEAYNRFADNYQRLIWFEKRHSEAIKVHCYSSPNTYAHFRSFMENYIVKDYSFSDVKIALAELSQQIYNSDSCEYDSSVLTFLSDLLLADLAEYEKSHQIIISDFGGTKL